MNNQGMIIEKNITSINKNMSKIGYPCFAFKLVSSQ